MFGWRVPSLIHLPTFAALAVCASGNLSFAQETKGPDSFINQQRAAQEQTRREFDSQMAAAGRAAFDWGGWYSLNVFMFDDGINSSRTLRRNDLRLWGRLTLDHGAQEFYARGRLSFVDFNHGNSYDGNEDDIEGPNLERGYYRFDLAKALQAWQGRQIDSDLVFTAGRDLVYFGTGFAFAAPLDHVSLVGTYNKFELTTLAGKTVGSMQDFDLSSTAARTHRDFYGMQLKYRGFEHHEPFAYALWQEDENAQRIWQPFQSYGYDSRYFGIGSTGELVKNLHYETEGLYEGGNGHHQGELQGDSLRAWAYRAQLEYLFEGPHKPRASVEYLYGSGDPERLGSPTNTLARNFNDGVDTSFIGFGFHDTGVAFAPRYSNLHMWRTGASFFPWPKSPQFERLELGTDWYLFWKNHHDGAVSDPTSDVQSGYLGWEMDGFANWRVTHDLAWTTRLGVFFPGAAFDDRTTRTFVLVGMVWSF
ncbi:MAG: alginate export family protein [Planctomycetes bacterium]|nr:alginate export family protein [Planctomycetota bacterium]